MKIALVKPLHWLNLGRRAVPASRQPRTPWFWHRWQQQGNRHYRTAGTGTGTEQSWWRLCKTTRNGFSFVSSYMSENGRIRYCKKKASWFDEIVEAYIVMLMQVHLITRTCSLTITFILSVTLTTDHKQTAPILSATIPGHDKHSHWSEFHGIFLLVRHNFSKPVW